MIGRCERRTRRYNLGRNDGDRRRRVDDLFRGSGGSDHDLVELSGREHREVNGRWSARANDNSGVAIECAAHLPGSHHIGSGRQIRDCVTPILA
jgi:hypothetical protein